MPALNVLFSSAQRALQVPAQPAHNSTTPLAQSVSLVLQIPYALVLPYQAAVFQATSLIQLHAFRVQTHFVRPVTQTVVVKAVSAGPTSKVLHVWPVQQIAKSAQVLMFALSACPRLQGQAAAAQELPASRIAFTAAAQLPALHAKRDFIQVGQTVQLVAAFFVATLQAQATPDVVKVLLSPVACLPECTKLANPETGLYAKAPNFCLSLDNTPTSIFSFYPALDGLCFGFPFLSTRQFDLSFAQKSGFQYLSITMQVVLAGISSASTIALQVGTKPVTVTIPDKIPLYQLCDVTDSLDQYYHFSHRILPSDIEYSDVASNNVLKLKLTPGTGYSKVALGELQVQIKLCRISLCLLCSTNACIGCQGAYYLQQNACVSVCNPGFYSLASPIKKCLQNCPPGYYNQYDLTCQNCPPNCASCLNFTHCLSCLPLTFLNNYICVESCSGVTSGQAFGDQTYSLCRPCVNPCFTCENSACLSCRAGNLFQSSCVAFCPDGTYGTTMVEKQGIFCRPCDSTCATCLSTSILCISCKSPLVQFGFSCLDACPTGTFSLQGNCQYCSPPCQSCLTSAKNCLSCSYGALVGTQCMSSCPIGSFVNGHICQSCSPNCDICIQAQSCVQCKQSYFLILASCTSDCPAGFYPGINTCLTCKPPCSTCTDQFTCKSCANGYANQGKCSQICPEGQYGSQDTTCKPCDSSCKSCLALSTACTSCPPSTYLDGTSCLASCLSGYYPSQNKCAQCSNICPTCSSFGTCLSCSAGFFLLPSNHCASLCPIMYFSSNGVCKQCPTNCKQCREQNVCITCHYTFFVQAGVCKNKCTATKYASFNTLACTPCAVANCINCLNPFFCALCAAPFKMQQNICVATCSTGSAANSAQTCVTCSTLFPNCFACSQTACSACSMGKVLDSNSCVQACPQTKFLQPNSICQACSSPCRSCTNQFNCLSCVQNFSYFSATKQCLLSCPNNYFSRDGACIACAPGCSICTSTTSCTSCNFGTFLSEGQCAAQCPSFTTIASTIFAQCQACQPPCRTCVSAIYLCLTCQPPTALMQNSCYDFCPVGFYSEQNVCVMCKPTCAECVGDRCTACHEGLTLSLDTCVSSCPQGQYSQSRVCTRCSQICATCSQLTTCTSCPTSTWLYQSQCLTACPLGSIAAESVCEYCPINCNKCESTTVCLTCGSSYLFLNGQCIFACPSQSYTDSELKTCVKCQLPCLDCRSQFSCKTCSQGFFLLNQDECVSSCPPGQVLNLIQGKCSQNCLDYFYIAQKTCFQRCPFYLYHLQKQCVSHCPQSHYVARDNTCAKCGSNADCLDQPAAVASAFTSGNDLSIIVLFSQPMVYYNLSSSLALRLSSQSQLTILSRGLQTLSFTIDTASPRVLIIKLPSLGQSNIQASINITDPNAITSKSGHLLANYHFEAKVSSSHIYSTDQLQRCSAMTGLGMFFTVVVMLLGAIFFLLSRLHLIYHLFQFGHWLWPFLLLECDLSPPLTCFLLPFKQLHLYFLNFQLVPSDYILSSKPKFHQFATDVTLLRNAVMAFLLSFLFLAVVLILWTAARCAQSKQQEEEIPEQSGRQIIINQHSAQIVPKHLLIIALLRDFIHNTLLSDLLHLVIVNLTIFAYAQFSSSSDGTSYWSFCTFMAVLAVSLSSGLVLHSGYSIFRMQIKDKATRRRWVQPMFLQLTMQQVPSSYRGPFLLLRRLAFAVALGYYSKGSYCLIITLILNVLSLVSLYSFRPFTFKYKNYLVFGFQLIASVVLLFLTVMMLARPTLQTQVIVSMSWVVFVFILLTLLLGIAFAFYQLYYQLQNGYKRIKKIIRQWQGRHDEQQDEQNPYFKQKNLQQQKQPEAEPKSTVKSKCPKQVMKAQPVDRAPQFIVRLQPQNL